MKKITSLMVMVMLCCIGAYAQVAATEYVNKLVKVGTAVGTMVPNTWYFLHNARNPNANANTQAMPGEPVPAEGGLVTDNGNTAGIKLTTSAVLSTMAGEGVNANDYMKNLVRFVPVEGQDGAFNIQFGTGNYMADNPNKHTVNKIQHIAGASGKYNFYLVKINGVENQAGRFGWNLYNMKNKLDNNGAGNDVVFWGEGERTPSEEEAADATGALIKSNNIWQIFSVEVMGEIDPYEAEFNNLLNNTYAVISGREEGTFVENLKANVNVGTSYGNYRPEDVAAFLALHTKFEEIALEVDLGAGMDYVQTFFPTLEDLKKFHNDYIAADKQVRENKIPLAVNNIANGYYTIDNILKWTETKKDTVRYTQQEADEFNAMNGYVEGDAGFVTTDSIKEVLSTTVDAKVKSLFSKLHQGNPWLAWGEKKPTSAYLWKIEKLAGSENKYRLINMYDGRTFRSVAGGNNTPLVKDDTVTVYFDYRGEKEAPVVGGLKTIYSIRNTYGTAESGRTCNVHCGGHGGGTGKEAWTVGWYPDGDASFWYLTPVDEKTAQEWMTSDIDKLNKMLTEANNIMNTVPGQLKIAKDIKITLNETDSVVVDATQIKANSTTLDGRQNITIEDTYGYLLDGNPATFWHSQWEGGNKGQHEHYLQISAATPLEGDYSVKITRRAGAANDHPVRLAVRGYDADDATLTFDQGVDLGVITFPFSGAGKVDVANSHFSGKGKQVIRFYWEASNGNTQRGYWHASGFNVFPATVGTIHATSQYAVRSAEVAALEAAMAKWAEGNYNNTDPNLVNDPQFQAAFNALVNAYKAWTAVYVNPTALRNAINAAPAADLFVTGTNPGQWPAGAETPASVVEAAKAYDAACAYTPAESEKLIKDIQNATANAFNNANKVKTNVWYRIKFPTEAMYDQYKWVKNSAKADIHELTQIQKSPALFGKAIAAADIETVYEGFVNAEGAEDTLAVYTPVAAMDLFEGQSMFFFDDVELEGFTNGEDLFRFIQATDSSYMIQNKATGLFVQGGHPATLSAVPSYFYTKAIGAGANIISYTNVLGEKVSNHMNFHGQRADNRLVCWEAKALGTNSMMMIEEVEAVTTEPTTTYTTKLWGGSCYTKVSPVDTKIIGGATAYGAELVLGADTAVVLKAIDAPVIKAGTPYVIIADMTAPEYKNPNDRKKELIAQHIAGGNQYGYNEKVQINKLLDDEYARVEMDHGMAVDTIQKGLGHLVGTFRTLNVKAGKGLVTKDNGFAHLLQNTNIGANRAYVACDFNAETTEVLGTIVVKVEGNIGTGIEETLNNVAKAGNIYTVDGKLVGKGNINTINNLPAGIYIVNGVKVIKN